jgi:hypothetical protein
MAQDQEAQQEVAVARRGGFLSGKPPQLHPAKLKTQNSKKKGL